MSDTFSIQTLTSALLALGAFQALLMSRLIWRKGITLLSIWLALFAVELISKVAVTAQIALPISQWLGFWFSFDLLYGPLLFLSVRQALYGNTRLKWHWLHFAPAVIFSIDKALAVAALEAGQYSEIIRAFFASGEWFVLETKLTWFQQYMLYHPTFYALAAVLQLIKHRFWFNQQRSDGLEVRYDWLLYMCVLQLMMWPVIIAIVSYLPFSTATNWLLSYVPAIIWINALAWLNFTLYQPMQREQTNTSAAQPEVEPITEVNTTPSNKYGNNKLSDEVTEQIEQALHQAMETGLFKQAKLSLDQLAEKLDLPSHWISQVLNDRLHSNYFDFINSHRIDAVKAELKNANNSNTILDIAFENGFNSKSTFNSVFKKQTGMTPNQYRQQHQQ